MLVPLKEIAVIHRQRKEIDPAKVSELAASIQEIGLLHPIVIRRPFAEELSQTNGSKYVLCVGGRRYAAHLFLGRTEIEASLKEELDPLRAEIAELEENIKRVDISWDDKIAAEARIHELRVAANPNHTLQETAEELGVDAGNLSRDLQLHKDVKADPSLKDSKSAHAARRKTAQRAEVSRRFQEAQKAPASVAPILERIVTADMRDYLKQLPTASVDLVFSDYPYGIDYEGQRDGHIQDTSFNDTKDYALDLIADTVPQLVRVVRPHGWIVVMTCWENYPFLEKSFADCCRTHFDYRVEGTGRCHKAKKKEECQFLKPELPPWIWYRPNTVGNSRWPELHAANDYELLCIVNAGQAKLVQPCRNVLAIDNEYTARLHQTQKPRALCLEIIRHLTVIGETVLDVCYGSGSALAAAAELNRKFLGCDINPKNREIAVGLISKYYSHATAQAVKSPQEIQRAQLDAALELLK